MTSSQLGNDPLDTHDMKTTRLKTTAPMLAAMLIGSGCINDLNPYRSDLCSSHDDCPEGLLCTDGQCKFPDAHRAPPASCSGEPADAGIELYAAQSMSHLLDPHASPADLIEAVLVQRNVGLRQERDFDLEPKIEPLTGAIEGPGYRVFVRGYATARDDYLTTGPRFFGGTRAFDIVSGTATSLSIQVGEPNCVALNNVAPSASHENHNADMIHPRVGHTLTGLTDGRVLVIGGASPNPDGTLGDFPTDIEIYDPNCGAFVTLPFQLTVGRAYHTATLLTDGTVLIYGGVTAANSWETPSEILFSLLLDVNDPSRPMTRIEAKRDERGRFKHQATRLQDGSVLMTGGQQIDGTPIVTTYRYTPNITGQPSLATVTEQGPLCVARSEHTASHMPGGPGRLIIAGGLGLLETGERAPLSSVEEFVTDGAWDCCGGGQPTADWGCFRRVDTATLREPRYAHQAVVVDLGRQVLFVGGYKTADRSEIAHSLELLAGDLTMRDRHASGDIPVVGGDLSATLLPTEEIVVLGGRQGDRTLLNVSYRLAPSLFVSQRPYNSRQHDEDSSIEGYSIESTDRGLRGACTMSEHRYGHQAVAMQSGTILVTGGGILVQTQTGQTEFRASRRADIYFPPAADLYPYYAPSGASAQRAERIQAWPDP